MSRNIVDRNLATVVMIGLTCVEQGLERKQDIRESILNYVQEHYTKATKAVSAQGVPLEVLDFLHRELGICFVGNDGKLSAQLPAGVV